MPATPLPIPLSRHDLNRRIQAYLRAFALRMEDHERTGCFIASFDEVSDNPYRNYAVPDDSAVPRPADIAALIAAFVKRRRKPRLEYTADAAPAVEPALLAHGFEIEKRYPLLLCTPDALREAQAPGFDIFIASSEDDILAAAAVGALAYGNEAPHPEPLRRLVAQGGLLAMARERTTGTTSGMGMATPAHDGVCEIAGIGVAEPFRRRGIAGGLTALLTREAFARGTSLAWLTPDNEGAERIYARAGFLRASEQLHISKPV